MLAVIGATIFLVTVILSIMMLFGAPLGELTMGGQFKVLPKEMRFLMIPQFILQYFGMKTLLQAAGFIPLKFSYKVTRIISVIFTIYFVLNTIVNFCSKSKKEKYISASLSAVIMICFGVTTLNMKKKVLKKEI